MAADTFLRQSSGLFFQNLCCWDRKYITFFFMKKENHKKIVFTYLKRKKTKKRRPLKGRRVGTLNLFLFLFCLMQFLEKVSLCDSLCQRINIKPKVIPWSMNHTTGMYLQLQHWDLQLERSHPQHFSFNSLLVDEWRPQPSDYLPPLDRGLTDSD